MSDWGEVLGAVLEAVGLAVVGLRLLTTRPAPRETSTEIVLGETRADIATSNPG